MDVLPVTETPFQEFSNITEYYEEDITADPNAIKYLTHGVTNLAIGCIGLIGNLLCSIVLLTPKLRSHPLNWYLLLLSICDSFSILFSFALLSIPRVLKYTSPAGTLEYGKYVYLFPFYLGFHNMSYLSSVYITMMVAIERFISLKWPLKTLRFSTLTKARKRSLIILTFFLVESLPQFWYLEVHLVSDDPVNYEVTRAEWTLAKWYRWNLLLLVGTVEGILPVLTLGIVNFLIYKKFKESQIQRKELLSSHQQQEASSPTNMLIILVLIAFITTLVPFGTFAYNTFSRTPVPMEFNLLGSTLETLNSSVNFFIYCLWGKNFRTAFFALFCFRKKKMETMSSNPTQKSQLQSTSV